MVNLDKIIENIAQKYKMSKDEFLKSTIKDVYRGKEFEWTCIADYHNFIDDINEQKECLGSFILDVKENPQFGGLFDIFLFIYYLNNEDEKNDEFQLKYAKKEFISAKIKHLNARRMYGYDDLDCKIGDFFEIMKKAIEKIGIYSKQKIYTHLRTSL